MNSWHPSSLYLAMTVLGQIAGASSSAWLQQEDQAAMQSMPATSLSQPSTTMKHAASSASTTRQVIIAELFTSQGCSSCPPADEVLTRLQRDQGVLEKSKISAAYQPDQDRPAVFIAWHVDYWDRLGWKDPFSSKFATDRQYADASRRNSQRVYTPQLIVHGGAEFVGSDGGQARRVVESVKGAAKRSVDVLIHRPVVSAPVAKPLRPADGSTEQGSTRADPRLLTVEVELVPRGAGSLGDAELVVVVTESNLSTEIPRGENAGRTLINDGVARAWKSVAIPTRKDKQEPIAVTVEIPANLKIEQSRLVAFLQERKSGSMLGAAVETMAIAVTASEPAPTSTKAQDAR